MLISLHDQQNVSKKLSSVSGSMSHLIYTTIHGQQFVSNTAHLLLPHHAETFCVIVLSLWVIPGSFLAGPLNIWLFYGQQKVSSIIFPLCEAFLLVNTERKWNSNFPKQSKVKYNFNRKWVHFHFFCAMLYLCTCTTLLLFTDCKISPCMPTLLLDFSPI